MRITLLLIISLLPLLPVMAQNEPVMGIKDPGDQKDKRCKQYIETLSTVPAEVRYTVIQKEGTLYMLFADEGYFWSIFDQKTDGIAVDIIQKAQYQCEGPDQHANSWAHKGRLMPPLYTPDFRANLEVTESGIVVLEYGKIPEGLDPNELEYNLLTIQKEWLCDTHFFYNVDYDTWSLLPTGLYRDSIPDDLLPKYKDLQKTMNFTVPFKKDQTVFDEADVKPIYDSLNLTDYLIKTINIAAYSSVEGPLDRNIRLQEGRAQSIVNILKAYQDESITSNIEASENWTDFLADIKNTEFASLGQLEQHEVKGKLAGNSTLLNKLEPILAPHRKAIITIELEKRINPLIGDPEVLKTLFDQSIELQQLPEALYLQEVAFERVRNKNLPESFIGTLKLPESTQYGSLWNNRYVFYAELKPDNLNAAINRFEALEKLLPRNPKVLYNLTVLKMQRWAKSEKLDKRETFSRKISELGRLGIADNLLRPLRINYHIVLTKYLHDEANYAMKNRSLRFLYNEYRRQRLEDDQLLRLAKFMTFYSRFDWAETLLKERVKMNDASTEMLFYYLNLTISYTHKTRRPDYQAIMDRAIVRDKARFCKIFAPKPQGGITMQLLDDPNLKRKFCEVCSAGNLE